MSQDANGNGNGGREQIARGKAVCLSRRCFGVVSEAVRGIWGGNGQWGAKRNKGISELEGMEGRERR